MRKRSLSVVKIGGSVVSGADSRRWITKLRLWANDRARRVVLVPGGGVFADTVRSSQARFGLDDQTAHELALLAMEQLGHVVAAMAEYDLPRVSLIEIPQLLNSSHLSLWVPSIAEFETTAMPRDWSVTSDSIALWLANNLQADELVLIKSAAPMSSLPGRWAADGYVDNYFEQLLAMSNCRIRAVWQREQL